MKKITPLYTEKAKARIKNQLSILVGQKVRELRLAKGLSQANLGHLIESNKQFVWKVENGKFNPTVATLFFLAEALECDVVELLPKKV